jgi:hypothetical protein
MINILSQSLANLRPGDPLEAGEKFLQCVGDRRKVGGFGQLASTGLAVPSGEVLDEHIARGPAVLPQAL